MLSSIRPPVGAPLPAALSPNPPPHPCFASSVRACSEEEPAPERSCRETKVNCGGVYRVGVEVGGSGCRSSCQAQPHLWTAPNPALPFSPLCSGPRQSPLPPPLVSVAGKGPGRESERTEEGEGWRCTGRLLRSPFLLSLPGRWSVRSRHTRGSFALAPSSLRASMPVISMAMTFSHRSLPACRWPSPPPPSLLLSLPSLPRLSPRLHLSFWGLSC